MNLLNANIGTNYKGILNLDATTINTPLDATLRAVTDGMGNSSALSLSTAAFKMSALTNDGTIVGSIFNSTKKVVEFSDRGAIFSYAFNGTNPTYSLGFYGAFDSGSLNLYGQGGTNGVFLTGYPVDNYILNNLIIGTSSAAIIKLGGTTASYPSIKRNGAAIDFRLADDSSTCAITVRQITAIDGTSQIGNIRLDNINCNDNSVTAINIVNTTGALRINNATNNAQVSIKGSGSNILSLRDSSNVEQVYVNNAGAIAINNTVAVGVGVASTHKVTIVIGGTTYYLLASNI